MMEAIIVLLLSMSIILVLSYFYYSTKIRKVKTHTNSKIKYKKKVKTGLSNNVKTMTFLSTRQRKLRDKLNQAINDTIFLRAKNDEVIKEKEKIYENETNLTYVEFRNNKFNRF